MADSPLTGMTLRRLVLLLGLALCVAPVAHAQTVVNPTQVVFVASADHNAVLDGQPAVTSYTVEVYDGSLLVRSWSVGKPTPNASNDIAVPLTNTGLANNKLYTAHVVTEGPGGSTRSVTPSNPFAFAAAPSPASNVRVVQ